MKNQELTNLERQKTKLLNSTFTTMQEFEEIMNKLNEVELRIQMIKEEN